MAKKLLLTLSFAAYLPTLFTACWKGDDDVILPGGFRLAFHAKGRAYIVSNEKKVVIPTAIRKIAFDSKVIYGYLESLNDVAFDEKPSGYFIIWIDENQIHSGLTWNELLHKIPHAQKNKLREVL